MDFNESFWSGRYKMAQTGWDVGYITTPLKTYFDQLKNKSARILIPGCGNAYEAEYLHQNDFENVTLVDISEEPLQAFKKRTPDFPDKNLLKADFFDLKGSWDLIIEQTFFSAIHPRQRKSYAQKCVEVLSPGGKLVGVLFDDPLFEDHPPFGGSKEVYLPVFQPFFDIEIFERCYNSIKPREGRELFIKLAKPDNQE